MTIKRFLQISTFLLIFFGLYLTTPKTTQAESFGLSITPPLTQVRLTPGQEEKLNFIIKNNGPEGFFIVNIHPFTPEGKLGGISWQKSLLEFDPSDFIKWFTFLSPKIKIGGRFYLATNQEKEIQIQLKPTLNTPEGDYYFSLTFENEVVKNNESNKSLLKTKIASNLLISLVWDKPIYEAKTKRFSVPRIIDSFFPFTISLEISNIGKFFFTPQGKITIESITGNEKVFPIAPLNILSGSTRYILCQNYNVVQPCLVDQKPLLGLYRATLTYNLNNNKIEYEQSKYFVSFPWIFSLCLLFGIVFILSFRSKSKTNV